MTPNRYIENLYEKQGHKVVCTSVELDLSYSATGHKDLEGKFTLLSLKNPKDLLTVEGLEFLNFYRGHTEVSTLGGGRDNIPTGVVDLYFFSRAGEVAAGLLQSFATQFSKGA